MLLGWRAPGNQALFANVTRLAHAVSVLLQRSHTKLDLSGYSIDSYPNEA
jgi:hypothetical protein